MGPIRTGRYQVAAREVSVVCRGLAAPNGGKREVPGWGRDVVFGQRVLKRLLTRDPFSTTCSTLTANGHRGETGGPAD